MAFVGYVHGCKYLHINSTEECSLSFFSSCAQGSSCIRSSTTGLEAGLRAVAIMNVYCSFVSLSLSACFHPLGIVCGKEHYSFFYVCLTHPPARTHTNTHTHAQLRWEGDQRLSSTYHTDGEQMQGVGCFAEVALVYREYESMFRRRSQMLPGKKHAKQRPTALS